MRSMNLLVDLLITHVANRWLIAIDRTISVFHGFTYRPAFVAFVMDFLEHHFWHVNSYKRFHDITDIEGLVYAAVVKN